jgi:hypothetical protein
VIKSAESKLVALQPGSDGAPDGFWDSALGHAHACEDSLFYEVMDLEEELASLGLEVTRTQGEPAAGWAWRGGSARDRKLARLAFLLGRCLVMHRHSISDCEVEASRRKGVARGQEGKQRKKEAREAEVLERHRELAGIEGYRVVELIKSLNQGRVGGSPSHKSSTVRKTISDFDEQLRASAERAVEAGEARSAQELVVVVAHRHAGEPGVSEATVRRALDGSWAEIRIRRATEAQRARKKRPK